MCLKAMVYVYEVSAGSVLFELNLTSAKVHLLVLYAIAASCIARSSNPAEDPSTKPDVFQNSKVSKGRQVWSRVGNW